MARGTGRGLFEALTLSALLDVPPRQSHFLQRGPRSTVSLPPGRSLMLVPLSWLPAPLLVHDLESRPQFPAEDLQPALHRGLNRLVSSSLLACPSPRREGPDLPAETVTAAAGVNRPPIQPLQGPEIGVGEGSVTKAQQGQLRQVGRMCPGLQGTGPPSPKPCVRAQKCWTGAS